MHTRRIHPQVALHGIHDNVHVCGKVRTCSAQCVAQEISLMESLIVVKIEVVQSLVEPVLGAIGGSRCGPREHRIGFFQFRTFPVSTILIFGYGGPFNVARFHCHF